MRTGEKEKIIKASSVRDLIKSHQKLLLLFGFSILIKKFNKDEMKIL
jgi:hypothetical protein